MGIRGRDYMKRPSDDDSERASMPDAKLEEFFSTFFQKHPRFALYFGIAVATLVLAAIVLAKFFGTSS